MKKIYWNNQGTVNCESHIPYKGTDTWLNEQWQAITNRERIEAGSQGHVLECEICKHAKKTRC